MSTTHARQPVGVAVLGTGALGSAIVEALLRAGHPVHVWNRTPTRSRELEDKGAIREQSSREAIQRAGLVIVTVSTYDAARAVLLSGDLAGKTIVNLASGTPDLARDMARWVEHREGRYLDGAAMSGTRLIGDPRALFLYAGSEEGFHSGVDLLSALGSARHLDDDPSTAAVYDTALLTMNLGLLSGAYHAMALTSTAGVSREDFASVAASYVPFAVDLMVDHARKADKNEPSSDDGTLAVYRDAIQHIIDTSIARGVSPVVPRGLASLVAEGIETGRGSEGLASLIHVIAGRG